ncbi:MAG: hypothetical protein M8357_02790 [Desulfobulbaceae bacterium]|nr:hypothetical protein [Desulfobulbaceae bacterium]
MMQFNQILHEEQEAIRLENTLVRFLVISRWTACSMVPVFACCKAPPPLKIFGTIFQLPFERDNFFRSIAKNQAVEPGKDIAFTSSATPDTTCANSF